MTIGSRRRYGEIGNGQTKRCHEYEGADVWAEHCTPQMTARSQAFVAHGRKAIQPRDIRAVKKYSRLQHGNHRRVLGPSLATMSLKWRWCLFVVMATAVFGGFIPNGPHPTALQPSRTVTLLAEELPIGPISCFGAWCNKGTPTPTTPPLSIAAVCAPTAGVLAFAVTRSTKRIRPKVAPLPEGNPTVPFRPPQFS
jgi:hypothetical protein